MDTKRKPATPLPWDEKNIYLGRLEGAILNPTELTMVGINASYIAHCCNNYPKLVETLRLMLETFRKAEWAADHAGARVAAADLLRELGED